MEIFVIRKIEARMVTLWSISQIGDVNRVPTLWELKCLKSKPQNEVQKASSSK